MASVNTVSFKVENLKGFSQAAKLAPKLILNSLKREFRREGNKLQTEFRKGYLFGSPGINLPRRAIGFTKTGKKVSKKIKNRDAKKTQLSHVLTKVVVGPKGIVLVGYLSHFLGFHAAKLDAPFKTAFRKIEPRLHTRLEKEAARITQAVLDKGLRDAR
ncbi:MAG: hypothetical protein R3B95_19185 [Nitrospirales bacterium]|nr:hypothetical protein [Nitrospirales bacterium]